MHRLSRLVGRFFGSLPRLMLVAVALFVAVHLAGRGVRNVPDGSSKPLV
jgi:hypothetical protein